MTTYGTTLSDDQVAGTDAQVQVQQVEDPTSTTPLYTPTFSGKSLQTLQPSTSPLPQHSKAEWRRALGERLECKQTHIFILILVIFDALCVLVEIIVSLFEDCSTTQKPVEFWAIDVLEILSLIVNGIFMLEVILCLVAFGWRYYAPGWPHWALHCLDAIVVTTTLVLELALKGKDREVVGLLILFRLWRVIKIMETVAIGLTVNEYDRTETLSRRITSLIEQLDNERALTRELEARIQKLEHENLMLQGSIV
ncbi:hypothetical protein BZG36_03796 [Bifiguratus adelaidae]|uniref:Voltage-gated hydrogen channel 1 n=1 Tax=Bifiguratus adelaidae TaxID=1938954 RepID=A0A261XWY5_9FUNG|nr:hypothetical protein BZG36_03796 [Bifiguratus adelaidae]